MNAALPQEMDELPKREVGAVLRAAREAAGMTVLDVSRQLNLGQATVEALEAGDMDALPPAAFVRGYLRSYGKLLELDVEMLLDLLDHSTVADPDIAPVTALTSRRASGDPLMRWMSVAVFFVLAVMVVIWWQTKNGVDETLTAQPEVTPAAEPAQSPEMLALQEQTQAAASQPEPEAAAEPVAPVAVESIPMVAEPEVIVDPQPEEPMPTVAEQPMVDEPVVADIATAAVSEEMASPPSPEPTAASSEAMSESPVIINEAGETETADAAVAVQVDAEPEPAAAVNVEMIAAEPEPETPAATDGFDAEPLTPLEGDEVVLLIDGSSWMEIRDALDRQLYYGMYDSPAPLRLTGQLPFVLFLGNSPAVTILYNGETYDQTSFNRDNNTARFALDTAGLRRP